LGTTILGNPHIRQVDHTLSNELVFSTKIGFLQILNFTNFLDGEITCPLNLSILGLPLTPTIYIYIHIWVFPKIGIPQNGWFRMENPVKMDDLGVPLFFGNIHIYI